MTEQKLKVYELAKELGIDSISLLDKLKQLDIDVKNHMSSLETEEVKAAREAIAKQQALLSKSTKTKTTKKKVEEPATQKRAATTVIRRRAKSAGDETAAAGTPQSATASSVSEQIPVEEEQQQAVSTPTEPEAVAPTMEVTAPVQEQEEEIPVVAAATPEPTAPTEPTAPILTATPTPVAAAPRTKTTTSELRTERMPDGTTKRTIITTSSRPASTPSTGSGLKMPSLMGARRQGLTTARTGSILNIVQEERRPLPSPRVNVRPNMPGGGPIPQHGTRGIVNLGKEAIDRLVEEENNFKKKGAGGRTERDKEPTDVKVADYRAKKELVFLPKKKKVPTHKEIRKTEITKPAAHKRIVKIENVVTVSELANRMGIKVPEIMKKLITMGVMSTLNQPLDLDTATLVAGEYGYEIENVAFREEAMIPKTEDKTEDLQPRPPIVTVMGHVDHGKTSLLDAIRSARVAEGEAGGITQHIGAYTVDLKGKKITFIDTPGHEAFTVMRARGANVTDIVVLVVAADDGVMPQTREAIDHARAASVPIIVAINKIDKPGANPDKVLKELAELNLLAEEWGGENIFARVSALKRTGIDELLESILLQAEVLDLKANPNRAAEGSVLEARLDRNRGAVVNILVKKGTLKVGDNIVAGTHCGRIRALTDDKGRPLKEVAPGYAAELLGLEGVPLAGDVFNVMASDIEARKVAEHRIDKARAGDAASRGAKMTLEDLFSKVQQGDMKELPVMLKADVFGSVEAIKESLNKLATEKVRIKVLSASPGGVSESDVMLASASNAIILAFNVRPETKAIALAEAEGVEIKNYSIIYELLDDVKKAMAGLLDKKAVERYSGRAEVRETFSVPKIGVIAGCSVIDGKINRSCQVRLLRDNRVLFTGKLSSLKRFKDDVKEVAQGYECGMGIESFNDIKQGDVIEAFTIDMVAQDIGTAVATTAAKADKEQSARA